MKVDIRVQTADFDLSTELKRLREQSEHIGAVASFVGLVRNDNQGDAITSMELEHYPGMTEKTIAAIVDEAAQRWGLLAVTVIHRVGLLVPGEQIVLVITASKHRGDAFQACEFIMDFVKTRAPFWKKEQTPDGARWVDARCSDNRAAERWN